MKFSQLLNIKMPTIVGIFICISKEIFMLSYLCFEQEYEKYQNFLSENFPFLVSNFSIYLNRRVFLMCSNVSFFCR